MPSRTSRPVSPRSRDTGALIDPYGIYGTRTANRMRAARRRRQSQNIALLISLIVIVVIGVAFARLRRVTAIKPTARLNVSSPIVTAPVIAGDEKSGNVAVLVSTANGQLLRVRTNFDSEEKPQTVLDTAFPLHLPLVRNEVAFVPCEDGFLYAVNWQNSKVLWRYNFNAPLCSRPAIAAFSVKMSNSTPPASAPPVVAGAAPSPPQQTATVRREVVITGSEDGSVAALDIRSGKPRWRIRVPAPLGAAVSVTNEVQPKILVPLLGAPNMRGGVWCLDAMSGKVLWRFPKDPRSEAMQSSAPIIDDVAKRAFFGGETGAIFSINVGTGSYDVSRKIGWKAYAPPLDDDSQTLISWRANPLLFFTDEYSGERDGRSTRLVVGGSDGGVRCFASRNGTLLWQFRTESPIGSLKKLRRGSRDLVLICTRGADMFVVDARSGRTVRRYASRGSLAGAALSETEILTVTTDGFVERFPLRL